jgi:hypothetical protein
VLTAHDLDHTTRSALEDEFLELCDRYGIPRPLVNTYVDGFEVDFAWPDARLIVETDSRTHHASYRRRTSTALGREMREPAWSAMARTLSD